MPTKIEWTDETWNPIRARNRETGRAGHFCVHVSPGCEHCYAEVMQARLFGNPVRYAAQDAEKVEIFLHENALMQPLRWRKPRRIFVCSMTDLFYEGHSDDLIDQVFAAMALAPQHTFQVLTKRAKRMHEYLTRPVQGPWAGRAHAVDDDGTVRDMTDVRFRMFKTVPDLLPQCPPGALNRASEWQDEHYPDGDGFVRAWPLPNVWLGTSIEGPAYWGRAEHLKQTPAAVRFLSIEPLIEGLGTHVRIVDDMDWVIVGGESGPKARPMHPQWARDLRDQCQNAGVAYFLKQWGEWLPQNDDWDDPNAKCWADGDGLPRDWRNRPNTFLCMKSDGERTSGYTGDALFFKRVGKKRAGRLLDGREWNEVPA